ncbi:hypothetical protein BH09BAC1_BH09BAC1_02270 [soil metagenome]
MRNFLPLLLLVLFGASVLAKQSPGGETVNPFASKEAVAYYPNATLQLPISLASVVAYLHNTIPYLNAEAVELELTAQKTSPGGEHFTFEQKYQGILVFNSQIKINLGKEGKVYSIFDNSYHTATWAANALAYDAEAINGFHLADILARHTGYESANIEEQAVVAVINGKPAAYKLLRLYHPETGDHRHYLLNKEGVIVYEHDLNAYSGVPGSGYVFNPDPITTAQTVYGAPYVDSNDANTMVLRNQRKLVNIEVTLIAGRYYLQNDHFVMTDFSGPNQTVVSSLTPSFLFNRSDTAFEEVNAYYHLTTFQRYIDSLGYTALTADPIQVDAHALNGSDNSQFSYGNGPRLFFGDGFVDDAEDADVIVHEYGHGLSYAGSPGSNFGNYRTAIDEGFGDYFAASYSRHLSSYNWSNIFSWDGHNEFWSGRSAATTNIYPKDLVNSIHRNGEMWATALMEVWSALGREKADKLALQTLFSLATNMNFTDAANAYLQADQALYGGANYNTIYTIMLNRGFFNTVGLTTSKTSPEASFAIYNSWAFTYGSEPAIVKNYTGHPMSLTLFDVTGNTLQYHEGLMGENFTFNGNELAPGCYIIKLSAGNAMQTFKLVK